MIQTVRGLEEAAYGEPASERGHNYIHIHVANGSSSK